MRDGASYEHCSGISISLDESAGQKLVHGLLLHEALVAAGPQQRPLVAAQARTQPWSKMIWLATNVRLFFTTLKSPVLLLFIVPTCKGTF